MKQLAVVIPCYRWSHTRFWMNLFQVRGMPGTLINIIDNHYVPDACNKGVADCLRDPHWDRLLIVEQDNTLPPDTFERHASYTQDVVASLYAARYAPYYPTARKTAGPGYPEWSDFEPGLQRVVSVPLGCTSISRRVLEEWKPGLRLFEMGYSGDGERVLHDAWFSHYAQVQGFELWADADHRVGHLGDVDVTPYSDGVPANAAALLPAHEGTRP